jgi:hypothetical protein
MLAVSYDLDPSGSFWTSAAAAELFWAIFVIALGIAAFVIALRPRRRKRTWTYDEPPHVERRRPARDDYRVSASGSAAKTRSTISPDSPR